MQAELAGGGAVMWGSHPQERPKRERKGEGPGAEPTGEGATLSAPIAAGSRWGPAKLSSMGPTTLLLPTPHPPPPPASGPPGEGEGGFCRCWRPGGCSKEGMQGGRGLPAWRLPHTGHSSQAPQCLERAGCGWWKGARAGTGPSWIQTRPPARNSADQPTPPSTETWALPWATCRCCGWLAAA